MGSEAWKFSSSVSPAQESCQWQKPDQPLAMLPGPAEYLDALKRLKIFVAVEPIELCCTDLSAGTRSVLDCPAVSNPLGRVHNNL